LGISNRSNKGEDVEPKIRFYPRMLTSLKDHIVLEISCGHSHSIAVTSEGKTFSWGNNDNNQLGVEGVDFAERPIEVKGLRSISIKSASCGYEHSIALSVDGELYSWGQGEGGLLASKTQS